MHIRDQHIRDEFRPILEGIRNGDNHRIVVSNPVSLAEVFHITEALKDQNCNVTSLVMDGIYMGAQGAELIAAALKNPDCNLTSLSLNNCQLGPQGAAFIAGALKSPDCNLSSLQLNTNFILNYGASCLAEALSNPNCKHMHLELGCNEISDKGAKKLAAHLESQGCKLVGIDLKENNITNSGAKAIAKAIRSTHCETTYVNLSSNDIEAEGENALRAAGLDTGLWTVTRGIDAPIIIREVDRPDNPFRMALDMQADRYYNNLNFFAYHKGKFVLGAVAACAIIVCYKKPEIIQDIFFGIFEHPARFIIGK